MSEPTKNPRKKQEDRPEARFGDVRAAGRKGAAAKEANALANITKTKDYLAAHAPRAAEKVVELADQASDATALKAAFGVLDRVGIGPSSSQDVTIGISIVETWIQEADKLEQARNVVEIPNEAVSSQPLTVNGELQSVDNLQDTEATMQSDSPSAVHEAEPRNVT